MSPEPVYSKHIQNNVPDATRKPSCIQNRTGFIIILCIALAVVTLAVYMQTGNHQFLNLDDRAYVTDNPHVVSGITGGNIMWAFTSVEAGNWHPVTWLSHMADVQLYGMNPRGHHLTSVAIHTISALLLFLLLLRLTNAKWQSLFIAALFALHPLHVESVAWVAERKDVLCAFFWFLTLLAYSEYVARRKPALYLLSIIAFLLGLMSKPMLVTLPIVMLLLDYWPLNRFRREEREPVLRPLIQRIRALLTEKVPFIACSLLSCLITIYAQHTSGAVANLSQLSFGLRIENALIAYVSYIGKTLWPHNLALYYPFPSSIPFWQVIGSLFILLFISAAAVLLKRSYPFVFVGWAWFIITLVPVIGLLQVGNQSMADRYSYVPVIGLFIVAAWGVPELVKGFRHWQVILVLCASMVIIASATLTWHQLGYWQDDISIYRQTLNVTGGNYMIHNNLGLALQAKGDMDAAIKQYREALRINLNYAGAHNNLGLAFQTQGHLDAAIQEYQQALRLAPNDTHAHNNLAAAFQTKGYLDAAIKEYKKALRIDPRYTDAHFNLGLAFQTTGDLDAAIKEYQEALRIDPHYTNAYSNMNQAIFQKRLFDRTRK